MKRHCASVIKILHAKHEEIKNKSKYKITSHFSSFAPDRRDIIHMATRGLTDAKKQHACLHLMDKLLITFSGK